MKITRVLGTLASVVVAAVSLTPVASAQTATAPDCQFESSYGAVVARGYLRTNSGNTLVGKIELCRDSSYRYWGFILLTTPLTASQYGDAVIGRTGNGLQTFVGCGSPGGNGEVLPGQTRCWTPKFNGVSSAYTFRAEGSVTSSHTGAQYAWGTTVETR